MSEEQKKQLEQQLWNIANTLRGKMNADEFRDYILGFIFYKYLSEKMFRYADSILKQDGIKYKDIDETNDLGRSYIEAVKEESLKKLGYFLKPSELFSEVARRGNSDVEGENSFILEDLGKILTNIEQSTMGTESEDDFDNLFEDLDLTSTKLGRTESAKNEIIAKVLSHLDKIDFQLENAEQDVLGDAYEYLIGQFASGAGKKAGEFYTPQAVSKVLAKIVTTGKTKLKSAYDPTAGSGSLLLRIAKEVKEVSNFYGQELNRTTYNLCRMNMILHDVHYRKFDIRQEDTLEHPQHLNKKFEAVVANPPFSAQWSASPLFMSDDRFSQYGKLAPSSKADFAFVQHMIYQLADNGVMAIVLPHGVLFRSGAEQHIRKYLIEDRNYLDAVIGLPANIFYGTEIPTCILVFKKCRESPNDVLFIDASQYYEKIVNQSVLSSIHIHKIISIYRTRTEEEKYSKLATLNEIADNNYNLNIPRYINTSVTEDEIDLNQVSYLLERINQLSSLADKRIVSLCAELDIPAPIGSNINLLGQYKKGAMRKIFTQEIRFSNDDGSDFPDWEIRTLGEIAKKKNTKNKDNNVTNVFTNSAAHGIVNQRDFFDKDIANQNNLMNYYIVEHNDFVYNPRISNLAPVGPISRNHLQTGVMSPLYSVFTVSQGNLDFFEIYFSSNDWHEYMKSIANYGARSDRMSILTGDFYLMPLPFPCLVEQAKIAHFLSAIDDKINLCSSQIEKTEQYKKDLLQHMFV